MVLLHAGTRLVLGLLPVLVFLGALVLLDSYKLVRPRRVLMMLLYGGVAAVVSFVVSRIGAEALDLDRAQIARYLAPLVEELLKAIPLVILVARRRVGFWWMRPSPALPSAPASRRWRTLQYFVVLGPSSLLLWVVRGFGTALMHGSATAVMAILSKLLADRYGSNRPLVYLPGLLAAVVLHSIFNHFLVSPTSRRWCCCWCCRCSLSRCSTSPSCAHGTGSGSASTRTRSCLQLIHSGQISGSRIGAYLEELKERLPPTVVADMLCLLRLRLELSIQAKGILLMRQSGFPVEPDPEVEAKFVELRYLENSIGPTGLLAITPFFHFSDRDLWQHHMLGRR